MKLLLLLFININFLFGINKPELIQTTDDDLELIIIDSLIEANSGRKQKILIKLINNSDTDMVIYSTKKVEFTNNCKSPFVYNTTHPEFLTIGSSLCRYTEKLRRKYFKKRRTIIIPANGSKQLYVKLKKEIINSDINPIYLDNSYLGYLINFGFSQKKNNKNKNLHIVYSVTSSNKIRVFEKID